jgi:hypothetical protein
VAVKRNLHHQIEDDHAFRKLVLLAAEAAITASLEVEKTRPDLVPICGRLQDDIAVAMKGRPLSVEKLLKAGAVEASSKRPCHTLIEMLVRCPGDDMVGMASLLLRVILWDNR